MIIEDIYKTLRLISLLPQEFVQNNKELVECLNNVVNYADMEYMYNVEHMLPETLGQLEEELSDERKDVVSETKTWFKTHLPRVIESYYPNNSDEDKVKDVLLEDILEDYETYILNKN